MPTPMHRKLRWERRLTRARAEGLFFLRALKALSRPFFMLLVVCLVGAVLHHEYGQAPGAAAPSWRESFFVSYCLLFLEHFEDAPAHPLGQMVHYVWPLLGIFLLSEGIIKLGITVFNKQADNKGWVFLMARASRGHVILCGLGTVGFRVLEELNEMGLSVFAIERDDQAQFLEDARELGAQVLIGDARTQGFLDNLNLSKARAVIIATDDDLANLEIAMDVREARADVPIVMRMFDQSLAQKVSASLGIQVSVSTSKLAAPLLASAALHPSVVGTHEVGGAKLVVVQLTVGEGLAGVKVHTLSMQHAATVIAVRPPDEAWRLQPAPQRVLSAGEEIQIMVGSHQIEAIHGLNGA